MRSWEELEEKIASLPSFDPNIVKFRRLYVSAAVECELDKAGRVLVPPALRDHASLKKDVLWAGMGRTVELWARERWDQEISLAEADREAFKRAVMEHIRV
jgi:MraZ protein